MCPFLIVLQLFSQSGKEINQKALFCTEKVLVLAFNKITFDTVSFLSASVIFIISQSTISQRLFFSGFAIVGMIATYPFITNVCSSSPP